MKKKVLIYVLITILLLFVYFVFFGWKNIIIYKIEKVNLPNNSHTVHCSKAQFSDVYYPHIYGEKVIECPMGYDKTKSYIEEHNKATDLENVLIEKYELYNKSDIAIYDAEFDQDFLENPNKDCYIRIVYFKNLMK